MVKNPTVNAEEAGDVGSILGQEDPLKKEMATHSRILAWEIPWTEEPWATVHGIIKRWAQLSTQYTRQPHFPPYEQGCED